MSDENNNEVNDNEEEYEQEIYIEPEIIRHENRRDHISLAIDNTSNGRASPLSEIPAVMSYLNSINAVIKGVFHARVIDYTTEGSKYQKDIATIKFDRLNGKVTVLSPWGIGEKTQLHEYMPSEIVQKEISAAWTRIKQMTEQSVSELSDLPDLAELARKQGGLYIFRSWEDARITCIEARFTDKEKDNRIIIVYTHYEDYGWLMCEPAAGLPIYNAHLLTHRLEKGKWIKGTLCNRVMLHEGPKAAKRYTDEIGWENTGGTEEEAGRLGKHPFCKELREFIHLGWIGGAYSAANTDFSIIKKCGMEIVYIVADHDGPGEKAVRRISYDLNISCVMISFTDEFPMAFDLYDDFPKSMWRGDIYIGPRMATLCTPCTWATDQMEMVGKDGKKRNTIIVRDHFMDEWYFITGLERYISRSMPNQYFKMESFNAITAGMSHTSRISTFFNSAKIHTVKSATYRPDLSGRLIVADRDGKAINQFLPTRLEAIPSTEEELEPWFTFMNGLITDDGDRQNTFRTVATLGGKLDVKMKFSLLLISDMTGTGKGTLQHICKLLVGHGNYSTPSEEDIMGGNNDWAVSKRLVIADEIYSNNGFSTGNKLKSMQTEEEFEVRIKYVVPYIVPNWIFIMASSNSMKAIKFDREDRRWFTPMVTEAKRTREYWTVFYGWLLAGGAGRILWWCQNYEKLGGTYFTNAYEAPDSVKKSELIEDGMNSSQRAAHNIAEGMVRGAFWGDSVKFEGPISIGSVALRYYITEFVNGNKSLTKGGQFINSDHELRKVMKLAGMKYLDRVIQHKGEKQRFIMNDEALEIIEKMSKDMGDGSIVLGNALIREWEVKGIAVCKRLREISEVEFGGVVL